MYELYTSPVTGVFFCLIVGALWQDIVMMVASQLANIALCLDR